MLNGLLLIITAADNQRKGERNLGYNYLEGFPKGWPSGEVLNGNDFIGRNRNRTNEKGHT